jgi:ATP-binding cassette subfamily F protein 3
MSLLTVSNLEKSYGIDTILSGIQFRLNWGQKVGLVGRNGTGKTTLLQILTGQLEPDKGVVHYARGIRFGYLSQQQMVNGDKTVYEEARDAFAPVLAMESRLRSLEQDMARIHGDEELLEGVFEEYGLLRERFEWMGGYNNLRDIGLILKRFGFSEKDFEKPASVLSGGEKTRLAMARLLLSAPDILYLDEPTNHLDMEATEWLETFLNEFGGAVLLVSHDRYFLDRVVNRIAELEQSHLTLYAGGFTDYWRLRNEKRERQAEIHQKQQEEIARLEEFWRRNKAGQNRNMAWSRLKAANRIRESAVDRPSDSRVMKLKFRERYRSGQEVLIIDSLRKQIPSRELFSDLNILINRGERVGIVGPNGAGKSTLLRIIMGEEQPTSGDVRLGAGVIIGYFAQEATELDPDISVLDTILNASNMQVGEARGYLARFLFIGDDVFLKVGNLSGGEKNRLALAQIILLRPNLLILDEPTNHLDIDSRDALTEMISEFDGTLILVSHDRYLLDQVTNKTLEILNGNAVLFDVPYSQYKEKIQLVKKISSANIQDYADKEDEPSGNASVKGMSAWQISKEKQKASRQIEMHEKRVQDIEEMIEKFEKILSSPPPAADIVQVADEYQKAQASLDEAMKDWEDAVHYAESLGVKV